MKNFFLSFVCIALFVPQAFSQKNPFKFGKVPVEELTMQSYERDPSAEAVVLYDHGFTTVSYNASTGWKLDFKRTCRIKIFNSTGFEWADEKISLYDYGSYEENVHGLKGYTYNLVDGKVVESKLEKDNIFNEVMSKKWKAVKFTMPNVKEGSVIEFTYTISSNYLTELKEWQFQKSIPVAWSEYTVRHPEYFTYLHLAQGFEQFKDHKVTNEAGSLLVNSQTINYKVDVFYWLAMDMPALKNESYISNASNFYQKVAFQWASYRSPDGKYEPILGTWEKINTELLTSSDFGVQIKPKGFYKDVLASITANTNDQKETAALIYKYISENIKWNEVNYFIPEHNIKKTFDEKIGRSADINMLLISMLNAAGIKASAVITSTRSNGMINPVHPLIDKYNYLLAEAIIDGKIYLMDATAKNLPLGMLPPRALNQLGRRICDQNPGWVDIAPAYSNDELKYYTLSLNEDGSIKGNVQRKKGGYNALSIREKCSLDGQEKYLRDLREGLPDWEIENHSIENLDNIYSDIVEKYDFDINNGASAIGNMIYLKPLFDQGDNENPFKKDVRKLPIDFVYPLHEKYIFVINLPDGYKVDELPENISLATPDNSCKFSVHIRSMGNNLQITREFNINRSFFGSHEYQQLKEFFDIVISKSEEQIVLKKI